MGCLRDAWRIVRGLKTDAEIEREGRASEWQLRDGEPGLPRCSVCGAGAHRKTMGLVIFHWPGCSEMERIMSERV